MSLTTIWIIAFLIVGLGWAGYGLWILWIRRQEKNQPKKTTEHLHKVKKSFDEYTEKMKDYKLKAYERKEQ